VAVKSNTIASLQSKLGDLRQALEQTMSKINDSNSIDKRVVSHLLVNYVSSVRDRRGDDADIIRVMAGLLNWDASSMRRVGLIDEHDNAADVQRGPGGSVMLGWGKSLLSGVGNRILGTPAKGQRPSAAGDTPGRPAATAATPAKPTPSNLAHMWVEFLLHEADKTVEPGAAGGLEGSMAATPQHPSSSAMHETPSGRSTPTFPGARPDPLALSRSGSVHDPAQLPPLPPRVT
jgi:hypothetical protein